MAKFGSMGGGTPAAAPAPQAKYGLSTLIERLSANRSAAPVPGLNPVFQRFQGAYNALSQARYPGQKTGQPMPRPSLPAPSTQAPTQQTGGFQDIFAAMLGNRR